MRVFAGICAAIALAACGGENSAETIDSAPASSEEMLSAAISGNHRSDEERARDASRHPAETLAFFGVEPEMTVVEAWPGGGWYTQILAPYLKSGGGIYYAAQFPADDPREEVQASLAKFYATYVNTPQIYGDIRVTALASGEEVAPADSADVVLTFRNLHNWVRNDTAAEYFAAFYRALKPGGVLGVVDHRADGVILPRNGSSGYLYTDDVVSLARGAGFEFAGQSEINANPDDTKDHPFGVWTLPPTARSSSVSGAPAPDFDRAPFDAIGESDRMTLKFVKPLSIDGALLE